MPTDITKGIMCLFESKIGLKEDAFKPVVWKNLIFRRMQALNIQDEKVYYNVLLKSEKEFLALTELVVVPETWFFREPRAIEYAAKLIAAGLEKHPTHVLDIACSTGAEPYSLAMLLLEQEVPPELYCIDAVDISPAAIRDARKAIYRPNSFRGKNHAFKNRFFEETEYKFALKSEVKQCVHFFVGNVVDPAFMPLHSKYDLIFCRNLFIYTVRASLELILKKIMSLLTPDGILFVGATEAEMVRRLGWIPTGPALLCAFNAPKQVGLPHAPAKHIEKHKLHIPKPPPETYASLEKALLLANQGLYEEALAACRHYIEKDGKLDAGAYFLLGVIEHASHHTEAAEAAFSKAVYLDPTHTEALTYQALLAEERGDSEKAAIFRLRLKRIGESHE